MYSETLYRTKKLYNQINKCYDANQQITDVFSSNCWQGKRVFIIGGGESLKGFDFNLLNNELTIGINKTFEHYSKATINFSQDVGFYDGLSNKKVEWNKFEGKKIFLTPIGFKQFGKDVYLVKKVVNAVFSDNLEEGVFGGSNSGTGALMLAAVLGGGSIYLLGYDFVVKNQTHWHGGYVNRDVEFFKKRLEKYCEEITSLAPILLEKGIKIYNLNKDSALKCFEFGDINEVLGANLPK